MTPSRKLGDSVRRLHAALGGPGLLIGAFALLSFGFGLYVLVREYDRPRRTVRAAVDRIVGTWVRIPDYLGRTLVDDVDDWRAAPPSQRALRKVRLEAAVRRLGAELDRQSERFPLLRVVGIELDSPDASGLARWTTPMARGDSGAEVTDPLPLTSGGSPPVVMTLKYRVAPALVDGVRDLEVSYRRLLLALIGLSGFSLLCLAYMVLHAQALSERAAREAAQEATLDLADRTCHELGNGVFVLTNERRNLADHLDLVERFIAEEAPARASAARKAGVDGGLALRLGGALQREYAERGIDPALELRASAAVARHVCRQIDVCSEYIGLTVRELDGFLKHSTLPVSLAPVAVVECVEEALSLLRPRLEAADARVVRQFGGEEGVKVRADKRLLIHALVNLVKNAVEAASGEAAGPEITVSGRVEGRSFALRVSDDGPGLAPEVLRRVFDVRQSTKGPGRGRGLAIVRESVTVQGGRIAVQNRAGGGAEFLIWLPLDGGPTHTDCI